MIIDERFEDRVLACLYRVNDFAIVAAQHLSHKHFGTPVRQNMASMAIDFTKKYSTHITGEAFTRIIGAMIKSKKIHESMLDYYTDHFKKIMKLDVSDHAFILESMVDFIKNAETRALIEEAVKKYLPANNFDEIERRWLRINAINAKPEAKATPYYDETEIDRRAQVRFEEFTSPAIFGISTGIKQMDDMLYKKGWYEPLNIILAPPKTGKTAALLYFSNAAAIQGFNVAFFSCETAKEILFDRMDAMNSSTEMAQLKAKHTAVAAAIKAKRPKGEIFIYEYPTKTLTTGEVERQVAKLERERGINIAMIVVDYAQIMKPTVIYKDRLVEEASVFEELRALAGKRKHPLLTAGQVNRENAERELVKGTGTAGTYEKIMVADLIITLSATPQEKKDNLMRIHFSEYRNGESGTIKIQTKYGMGRFYDEFVERLY